MVKNFEEITAELSKLDKQLIPFYVDFFSNWVGSEIKQSPVICKRIEKEFEFAQIKNTINGVKLRKIVNYIRSNSLLPIIATSKGYSVSYNLKDIENQIISLRNRRNAIDEAIHGLTEIYTQILRKHDKQMSLKL